jgi:ribosomal protein L44E
MVMLRKLLNAIRRRFRRTQTGYGSNPSNLGTNRPGGPQP